MALFYRSRQKPIRLYEPEAQNNLSSRIVATLLDNNGSMQAQSATEKHHTGKFYFESIRKLVDANGDIASRINRAGKSMGLWKGNSPKDASDMDARKSQRPSTSRPYKGGRYALNQSSFSGCSNEKCRRNYSAHVENSLNIARQSTISILNSFRSQIEPTLLSLIPTSPISIAFRGHVDTLADSFVNPEHKKTHLSSSTQLPVSQRIDVDKIAKLFLAHKSIELSRRKLHSQSVRQETQELLKGDELVSKMPSPQQFQTYSKNYKRYEQEALKCLLGSKYKETVSNGNQAKGKTHLQITKGKSYSKQRNVSSSQYKAVKQKQKQKYNKKPEQQLSNQIPSSSYHSNQSQQLVRNLMPVFLNTSNILSSVSREMTGSQQSNRPNNQVIKARRYPDPPQQWEAEQRSIRAIYGGLCDVRRKARQFERKITAGQ